MADGIKYSIEFLNDTNSSPVKTTLTLLKESLTVRVYLSSDPLILT